jgi:hypothetical protein
LGFRVVLRKLMKIGELWDSSAPWKSFKQCVLHLQVALGARNSLRRLRGVTHNGADEESGILQR